MDEGLGPRGLVGRPDGSDRALYGLRWWAARTAAGRRAAPGSSGPGTTSETRPVSWARRAPIRSAVPIRAMRITSPYGMCCVMAMASYALTMP